MNAPDVAPVGRRIYPRIRPGLDLRSIDRDVLADALAMADGDASRLLILKPDQIIVGPPQPRRRR